MRGTETGKKKEANVISGGSGKYSKYIIEFLFFC